ncbi:hypothetical protein C8F04DRAFT_1117047 [Mycena alexandri]|uniref:G-protein coupled receptors family 2 profile 2 domain-containing protein n=1 Tax=Mycena alexandri TaxID=1745969 RepID=A0AAD6SL27_9AGAR|nr:hypothetical protein C8F04DRAFT_1117047 [Mycena alexandri]
MPLPELFFWPTTFDSHISDLLVAFAVSGVVFISLILGACAWAAWNLVSRPYLNRVSFRLLVYALVANLAYGGCMIGVVELGPGAACSGVAFLIDVCLMFSAVMFFCVALNLQLVLVHGFNGQRMEKYYILAAVITSLGTSIPPYAAGRFGYWPGNETCWLNSLDPAVQLRWWIASQGLWMLLMSAGEVVTFFVIVGSVIMRHRTTSAISTGASSSSSFIAAPKPAIVLYRKIIIRIGLYPLVSCFLSFTAGVLDLHVILDSAQTETNWRLSIVDLLVYSLRPMFYAVLAATDPSFIRALRTLLRLESGNPEVNTSASLSVAFDTEIYVSSIKSEDESGAFARQI